MIAAKKAIEQLGPLLNPFGKAIVRDAWKPADIDVPEIHARTYAICLARFNQVASGRGSESILIHGPAGSGKTHLLGRLQQHLIQTAAEAPDRALRCIFISIKLQTSARMLWQHLRRRVAEDLLRIEEGASQLQRLVAHFLAACDPGREGPRAWVRKIRVLSQIEDPAVEALLDQIDERAHLGRDLRLVLSHLVYRRSLADARSWLAGENIPDEARQRLGLGRDVLLDQDPEYAARELILAICRLAGDSLPLVFCFDQIEALQTTADDLDPYRKFGDLVASIFNSTDNTLLISCVQSAFTDRLKDAVLEADRARLARVEATLDPLTRAEAMLLIDRRLDAGAELRALRAQHPQHPHWPFRAPDLDPIFVTGQPVTARRVLYAAENLFSEVQTGRAVTPPPPHPTFLAEEFERRVRKALAEIRPAETETIIRHGLPLVVDLANLGWSVDAESADRDVELNLCGPASRVGVSVCCHENMNKLAWRLRRLKNRLSAPGQARLVLLRDPRLPISRTAERTRAHLDELREQGVPLMQPPVETLAVLHALRTLISDARAGDLDNAGVNVPPATLQEWLSEALDDRLRSMLVEIIGAETLPDSVTIDVPTDVREINDVVAERHVVQVAELAQLLGKPDEYVLELARRHPDLFGVLDEPPSVVFEYVPPDSLAGQEERT